MKIVSLIMTLLMLCSCSNAVREDFSVRDAHGAVNKNSDANGWSGFVTFVTVDRWTSLQAASSLDRHSLLAAGGSSTRCLVEFN